MGYIDLIPDVFRLTMPDLTTSSTYRTTKFNVGNKSCIGVTIKASQTLSVAVAYGIVSDTAAAAGGSASLPYKTSATSFASSTGTEAGTYHEIAIPPHARQAQLVISNASGSTVSGAVIDAALRVVAYPAASSGGSSAFGDITGWPGASTDFIRGDGSDGPLSATEIPVFWVATTTRSTNAFSGSLPTTPAYTAGLTIRWKVPSAPAASPTYNLNSLGAKNIYLNGSAAPVGAFVANRIIEMMYDGTQFAITGFDTLVPGDIPAKRRLVAAKTASQTVSAASKITFDTPGTNDGDWTYSSSTFTATRDHVARLELALYSSANPSAIFALQIKVNGTIVALGSSIAAQSIITITRSVKVLSGDTVEIWCSSPSGSCLIATDVAYIINLFITEG